MLLPLQAPSKLTIPGSKSFTNRALIMAALTKGPVELVNPPFCDDTKAMIHCLQILGLNVETAPDRIIVHDDISCIEEKHYHLYACDSGTTARFLLALLCLVPGTKTLTGSASLNRRPMGDLVEALRKLGATIEYLGAEERLPVKISSSRLTGNSVSICGEVSSQFSSALLLIAPYISENFTLLVRGHLISKPYIEMTRHIMAEWGVMTTMEEEGKYRIPGRPVYQKKRYVIEGDYSSAGYFFAIAALNQSTITLDNLNPSSTQADRKFLGILEGMGNRVHYEESAVTVEGRGILAEKIDMEDCPDQVMTMAVLAAFAKGVTTIRGVRSLRVKETERVIALKNELKKKGIQTEDTHDSLTIYGGTPQAATIETYNDHRIAMAFAVAKSRLPELVICNPEVVNKTFPTFWESWESLR